LAAESCWGDRCRDDHRSGFFDGMRCWEHN
jgi:hypothetical protein